MNFVRRIATTTLFLAGCSMQPLGTAGPDDQDVPMEVGTQDPTMAGQNDEGADSSGGGANDPGDHLVPSYVASALAPAAVGSARPIAPDQHPNLYFNRTEIDRLRKAILVDGTPTVAVNVYNAIRGTAPQGKPSGFDSLGWSNNYATALPITKANMKACFSYMIEPTSAKASALRSALLSWTAPTSAGWLGDPQAGGHIHFPLAWMYDLLYNSGSLSASDKTALDGWFRKGADTLLKYNSWWSGRSDHSVVTKEGSERHDYNNWWTFMMGAGAIFAFVSHDQGLVDRGVQSGFPENYFKTTDIAQYAPASRDLPNMINGLVYPSGYDWDGYLRDYGFNAPTESYSGQRAGQGQSYHFFALLPLTLAAEAAWHNGFDAWSYANSALKRGFVTGRPWAPTAFRKGDGINPDRIYNWLPAYWTVIRHHPSDSVIREAVNNSASLASMGHIFDNTAPLWGALGLLGEVSSPPAITSQPGSQTVAAGQTATFSVSAMGTAPWSYQWQKNGANLSGAISSSYTTPASILSDSGSTYRVIVSNSLGSATSASATLTVTSGTDGGLLIAGVTASSDDGNAAANTIDGDLSTRWSAYGDGQWVRYDLGSSKAIGAVKIAWYAGNTREAHFDIQLSGDGATWNTVHSGTSSGTTVGLEAYDFADAVARYVRIVGHGNSTSLWNSITEVVVVGGSTSPSSANLAPNQGFEADPTVDYYQLGAGTFTWATDQKHGGSRSLKIASSQAAGSLARWLSQTTTIQAQAGAIYKASAWFKTANVTDQVMLVINFWNASSQHLGTSPNVSLQGTADWTPLSVEAAAPSGTAYVRIEFRLYGPGTMWADDVALTK